MKTQNYQSRTLSFIDDDKLCHTTENCDCTFYEVSPFWTVSYLLKDNYELSSKLSGKKAPNSVKITEGHGLLAFSLQICKFPGLAWMEEQLAPKDELSVLDKY